MKRRFNGKGVERVCSGCASSTLHTSHSPPPGMCISPHLKSTGGRRTEMSLATQVAGTPPSHIVGLKIILVETLNNVGHPTRCPQPIGTPNGVLHCSMSPQWFFKPALCKGGVPATCVHITPNHVPLPGSTYTRTGICHTCVCMCTFRSYCGCLPTTIS